MNDIKLASIALEDRIARDQARIELCFYMRNVLAASTFGGGMTGAQLKLAIANDEAKLKDLLRRAQV